MCYFCYNSTIRIPVVESLLSPCLLRHSAMNCGLRSLLWSLDKINQELLEEPLCTGEPSRIRIASRVRWHNSWMQRIGGHTSTCAKHMYMVTSGLAQSTCTWSHPDMRTAHTRGYIQKFLDWVDNEINNKNNIHSEKQHKWLWRQNSLDWLAKWWYNCAQWQTDVPFAVLPPGGQSGNFWIHPPTWPHMYLRTAYVLGHIGICACQKYVNTSGPAQSICAFSHSDLRKEKCKRGASKIFATKNWNWLQYVNLK
jgi:hypothetical protein